MSWAAVKKVAPAKNRPSCLSDRREVKVSRNENWVGSGGGAWFCGSSAPSGMSKSAGWGWGWAGREKGSECDRGRFWPNMCSGGLGSCSVGQARLGLKSRREPVRAGWRVVPAASES